MPSPCGGGSPSSRGGRPRRRTRAAREIAFAQPRTIVSAPSASSVCDCARKAAITSSPEASIARTGSPGTEHPAADIVIDDGVITAIGPGAAAGIAPHQEDIDGTGLLAIPGLVKGIGTDEGCVDDGVNFWSAVKNTGLVHNITTPEYRDWPAPGEILRAATAGGHAALRTPGLAGTLSVGALADIVLMDLATLPFVPLNDTQRQLVYCEPARSVTTVIVGGEVVVSGRRVHPER